MPWWVSVSPGWDLWGTAMLGTAALCGLSWFAVVARRLSGRSTSAALVSLGLCELGFFSAAALGTLQQLGGPGDVDSADTSQPSASPGAAEPDPTPSPDTSGEDVPSPDVPAADTDAQDESPDEPDSLDDSGEDTPQESPDGPAEEEPNRPTAAGLQVGTALDPVPALPDDASERRAAIRRVLRSARLVYEDEAMCKDAAAVGRVWAAISAVPKDERNARAGIVAKRLEECRRQVRWAKTYSTRRSRLAAREKFEQTLSKRLSEEHEIKTFIKISGRDHEKMRVGSGALDDELAEAIMTDALKTELADLGFERVVLATGKKVWRTDLDPRPESDYIDEALAPYGLHAKLEFTD